MFSGTVSFVNKRPYNGNMLYSFRLTDDSNYYNCGTTPPPVDKGAIVEFEAAAGSRPGAYQVDLSSIKITKPAVTEVVQASAGGFRKTWPKKDTAKDDYWKDREARDIKTQEVIQLQSSRNSAIALANLIITHGGLKLDKLSEAKKMAAIEDLVDHLTEKYETQAKNRRTGADQVIPEVATIEEAQEKIDEGEWE